jgi:hypothetical protein
VDTVMIPKELEHHRRVSLAYLSGG